MKALSAELIAIVTVGVALSGVVLTTTGRLSSRIDGLDTRLRAVEEGQTLLIERTGTLDIRLKALEDGYAMVRAELTALGEEQASFREEMAALRNEMAALRNEMAALREGQAELRSDLASVAERVARVEGLLDGLRIALDRRLPPAVE